MGKPDIDTLDTIKFRMALEADVDNLIQIHLNSFQGYLNTLLGTNYLKAMFKWFIKVDSALLLVCYNSEQIIGYAMGAQDGYSQNMQKDLLPNIIWGMLTNPQFIIHPNVFGQFKFRLQNILNVKSKTNDKIKLKDRIIHKDNTYALVGLAISPEFRGSIITFKLLKEFENHVWRRKFEAIRLTVYKFNASVIQLYKYMKWKLYFEDKNTVRFIKTKN